MKRLLIAALAAASMMAGGPAALAATRAPAPQNFPRYFLLQVVDGHSVYNGEYLNDIHGRGASAEFADYHHTPLHMRLSDCFRDSRNNTWCLWEDERHNCLSARIHPKPHAPADAMFSACNRSSFYEQWRFVKTVVGRRILWDPLNRHYQQYLTPEDITSCETVTCPAQILMWPAINSWGVPKA